MAGWLVSAACVLWLLRVSRFSGIVAVVGQRQRRLGAARVRCKVVRSGPRAAARRMKAWMSAARPPGKFGKISVWYLTSPGGVCGAAAKSHLWLHSALQRDVRAPEPSLEGIARKKTGLVSARRSKTELGAKHRKTLQRGPRGPKKKRWSASA